MRLPNLLAPLFLLALTTAQNTTVVDLCPKGDYACLDVINSSQCLEQLVIESQAPVTKESMAKCVVFDESAVDLPGDVKLCRCTGCHTKPINDAIVGLFPGPCA